MKRGVSEDGKRRKKVKIDLNDDDEFKKKKTLTVVEELVTVKNLRNPDQKLLWICELLCDLESPKVAGIEMLKSFRQKAQMDQIEEIFKDRKNYECLDLNFTEDQWYMFLIHLEGMATDVTLQRGSNIKTRTEAQDESLIDDDSMNEGDDMMEIIEDMGSLGLSNGQIDDLIEEKLNFTGIEAVFDVTKSHIGEFSELENLCSLIMILHMNECNDRVNHIWGRLNDHGFRTLYKLTTPPKIGLIQTNPLGLKFTITSKHEYDLINTRIRHLSDLFSLQKEHERKYGDVGMSLDRKDKKPRHRRVQGDLIFEYFHSGLVFVSKLPQNPNDVVKFMMGLESREIRFKLRTREFYREVIFDPTKSMIDYLSSTTSNHDWDLMISSLIMREVDVDAKMARIEKRK